MCTVTITPDPPCNGQDVTITVSDPNRANQVVDGFASDAGADQTAITVSLDASGSGSTTLPASVSDGWQALRVELEGCSSISRFFEDC